MIWCGQNMLYSQPKYALFHMDTHKLGKVGASSFASGLAGRAGQPGIIPKQISEHWPTFGDLSRKEQSTQRIEARTAKVKLSPPLQVSEQNSPGQP
jgi:hypothetical protein